MTHPRHLPAVFAAVAMLSACATMSADQAGGHQSALVDAAGKEIGQVTIVRSDGETKANIEAQLPAGVHGVHLHTTGLCAGPKFESAGPHWNPTQRMHGLENPQGPHRGDLPNIVAAPSGRLSTTINIPVGLEALSDADGTAFVVHSNADDYRTDPSGASGERIACAVLAPPRG